MQDMEAVVVPPVEKVSQKSYEQGRDELLHDRLDTAAYATFGWFFSDNPVTSEPFLPYPSDFQVLRNFFEDSGLASVFNTENSQIIWTTRDEDDELTRQLPTVLNQDVSRLQEFQINMFQEIIAKDSFLTAADNFFKKLLKLSTLNTDIEKTLSLQEAQIQARDEMNKKYPGWDSPVINMLDQAAYNHHMQLQREFNLLLYRKMLQFKQNKDKMRAVQRELIGQLRDEICQLLGIYAKLVLINSVDTFNVRKRTYKNPELTYGEVVDTPLDRTELQEIMPAVMVKGNTISYRFTTALGEPVCIVFTGHDDRYIKPNTPGTSVSFEFALDRILAQLSQRNGYASEEAVRHIIELELIEKAFRQLKKILNLAKTADTNVFLKAINEQNLPQWMFTKSSYPYPTKDMELTYRLERKVISDRPHALIFWQIMEKGLPFFIEKRRQAIMAGKPSLAKYYEQVVEPEKARRFREYQVANGFSAPKLEDHDSANIPGRANGIMRFLRKTFGGNSDSPAGHESTDEALVSADETLPDQERRAIDINNIGEVFGNFSLSEIDRLKQEHHFSLQGNGAMLKRIDSLVLGDTLPNDDAYLRYQPPLDGTDDREKQVRISSFLDLKGDQSGYLVIPVPPFSSLENLQLTLPNNLGKVASDEYVVEYNPSTGKYRLKFANSVANPHSSGSYRLTYDVRLPEPAEPLADVLCTTEHVQKLIEILRSKNLTLLAETIQAFLIHKSYLSIYSLTEICKKVSVYSYDQRVSLEEEKDIFDRLVEFINPETKKFMLQCVGAARLLAGCLAVLFPTAEYAGVRVGVEKCYKLSAQEVIKDSKTSHSDLKLVSAADSHLCVILHHDKGVYRLDSTPTDQPGLAGFTASLVEGLLDKDRHDAILDPNGTLPGINLEEIPDTHQDPQDKPPQENPGWHSKIEETGTPRNLSLEQKQQVLVNLKKQLLALLATSQVAQLAVGDPESKLIKQLNSLRDTLDQPALELTAAVAELKELVVYYQKIINPEKKLLGLPRRFSDVAYLTQFVNFLLICNGELNKIA